MVTVETVAQLIDHLKTLNQQARVTIELYVSGTDYTEDREVEVSEIPGWAYFTPGSRVK
jgi:hypothetical protein